MTTLPGTPFGVCRRAPAYHGRQSPVPGVEGMAGMNLQDAMKNPARFFSSPEAIESSSVLSAEQKHAVLLQWKDQLQQLMVATEENMPVPRRARA